MKKRISALSAFACTLLVVLMTPALVARAEQAAPQAGTGVSKPITLTVGKAQTLDFNQDLSEILIASPDIVDVGVLTKRRVYIVGRNVGDTNIMVFDKNKSTLATLDVNISQDQFTLQRVLRQYFPDEAVTARTINRDVILTGSVSNPNKAGQIRDLAKRFVSSAPGGTPQTLVDLMTVQGEQQVSLQVKIVEVKRNVLKEYGIDTDISNIGDFGNFSRSGVTSSVTGKVTASPFSIGNLVYETGSNGPISLQMQALEEKGLLNTLAEPNLTAISGQRAEFLAGGEYPIPVGQQNNQVTIEFKKFGVALGFVPVVLSNDKIQLELETEVSVLSNEARLELQNESIPSLSVRRAKTTVEMASGGSLMIAGLIQSDTVNTMDSLPGINKIPVIGKLFSSQSFKRNESELLVMVTPYLVRPSKNSEAVVKTSQKTLSATKASFPVE